MNVMENPLAISLFGPVGIEMVTKNFAYLVHQLEFWIWPENRLIFHNNPFNIANGKGFSNKWKTCPCIWIDMTEYFPLITLMFGGDEIANERRKKEVIIF